MPDINITVGVKGGDDIAKIVAHTKRLENNVKSLATAFGKGRVDNQAYFKGLNQQISALTRLGYSYKQAQAYVFQLAKETRTLTAVTNQATAAANKSTVAMDAIGKRANRAGVVFQQAGYQIGDFIVQAQSGTDIMVALGQQMTQMVGVGAMLSRSTKWIVTFSALGIIVPLATALAGAFLRMNKGLEEGSKKAKTFKEALESAESAIQRADSSMLDVSESGLEALTQKYGNLTQQVLDLQRALNAIEIKSMVLKVTEAIDMLLTKDFYTKISGAVGPVGAAVIESTEKDIAAAQKAYNEALTDYKNAIDSGVDEGTITVLASILVDTHKELALLTDNLEEAGDLVDELKVPPEVLYSFKELQQKIMDATAEGNFEGAANAISSLRALVEQLGIEVDEGAFAELTKLEDVLRAAAKQMNAMGGSANDLVPPLLAAVRAANNIAEAFAKAKRESSGIKFDTSTINLQIAALKAGKSEAEATALAAAAVTRQELTASFGGNVGRIERLAIEAQASQTYQDVLAQEKAQAELDALTKKDSGGDKETAEERLASLLRTAELEKDLVGVEEERATQLRRAFDLTEQISQMEGGLTEERMKSIQTIVDLEAKTRLLQEAEERREAQIDEIVGHIRSAFDSLIDGTETVEEAFRKMMYNIARSIWEQQVMDPLANAATKWITSTFFSAKGSAWNNGVQMFANGGVVNSATPFRHAGGMGIMGEAGAEAIMPLKRGPDGKLGVAGGGGVVIHQNFNFAANGDESVKRIIAQEAPKIASMTQGQIMDARRRGGAMRNTFG